MELYHRTSKTRDLRRLFRLKPLALATTKPRRRQPSKRALPREAPCGRKMAYPDFARRFLHILHRKPANGVEKVMVAAGDRGGRRTRSLPSLATPGGKWLCWCRRRPSNRRRPGRAPSCHAAEKLSCAPVWARKAGDGPATAAEWPNRDDGWLAGLWGVQVRVKKG